MTTTDESARERPVVPAGFDAPAEAKRLLRTVRTGTLATIGADGFPLATLVTVATDLDGAPLILVSALSVHTRNLDRDGRASLLLPEAGKGDPLAHPRLSVTGTIDTVARDTPEGVRVRRRFLARHPKAALYADFGDFSFRRLRPAAFHLNGGFARAADLAPPDVLTPLDGADDLVALEADAVTHMNEDHADALSLYARVLCGVDQDNGRARWQATGLDPEGLDLAAGDRTARLVFPERVTEGGALRRLLGRLATEARARLTATDGV